MVSWPRHPVIYEINTWVWLRICGGRLPYGRHRCGSVNTLYGAGGGNRKHYPSMPAGVSCFYLIGIGSAYPIGSKFDAYD
jgi:hypothetical protein